MGKDRPRGAVRWVAGAAAGGIAAAVVLHAALVTMAEETRETSGGAGSLPHVGASDAPVPPGD